MPANLSEVHHVHGQFQQTANHNIGQFQLKAIIKPLHGIEDTLPGLQIESQGMIVLKVSGAAPMGWRKTEVHPARKGPIGVDLANPGT
jgi:hypothetical protein